MSILVQQGSLPDNARSLEKLVDSRPFTHQLDAIFASDSSEELSCISSTLQTSFYRARVTFSNVFSSFSSSATSITALSVGSLATEDVWCIDARSKLTLSLTQDTYELLGMAGTPVGPPRYKDRFIVTLDLHDSSSRLAVRARESLKQWDIRRAEAGEDGWNVLLSSPLTHAEMAHDVKPVMRTISNVQIPSQALPSFEHEAAEHELSALFEWVGLASLGSQRLHANDDVSSYVASYDPPAESSAGDIVQIRWTGLLTPPFVHRILKEALGGSARLLAITATSFDSPASYISTSGASQSGKNVWTLIASRDDAPDLGTALVKSWVLAEAGRWYGNVPWIALAARAN